MEELQLTNDKLKLELLNKFEKLGFSNLEAIKLVVELVFEKNQIELLKQTEYTSSGPEDNNNDKAIEKWRKWK